MTSSTRITDISGGTTYQLVAQPVVFRWMHNPELNTANIRVEYIEMLEVDGTTRMVNYGDMGNVSRVYSDISNFSPCTNAETDPVTGADLTQISIAGMLVLQQQMFDKMFEQDHT